MESVSIRRIPFNDVRLGDYFKPVLHNVFYSNKNIHKIPFLPASVCRAPRAIRIPVIFVWQSSVVWPLNLFEVNFSTICGCEDVFYQQPTIFDRKECDNSFFCCFLFGCCRSFFCFLNFLFWFLFFCSGNRFFPFFFLRFCSDSEYPQSHCTWPQKLKSTEQSLFRFILEVYRCHEAFILSISHMSLFEVFTKHFRSYLGDLGLLLWNIISHTQKQKQLILITKIIQL